NSSSAKKLLTVANDRLYAINRENNSPEIWLETPTVTPKSEIEIGLDKKSIMVTGKVTDKSLLAGFSINNIPVRYEGKGTIPFAAEVEIPSDETLRIVARDVYDNEKVLTYRIRRTEVDPPEIQILAPYILGENVLVIDSIASTIDIEGRVKDQNLIRSVKIEKMSA